MSRLLKRAASDSPLRNPEFVTILGIVLVVMTGFGLISPILPRYAQDFGVSQASVSYLVSGFAVVRLLSQPPGGWWMSRFGERSGAVLGAVIVSASSFGCAVANTFGQLLVARCLGGIGSAVFVSSLFSLALKVTAGGDTGSALSLFQSSFTVGAIIGPVIGGVLADAAGLRAPFFVYGVACVLTGILCLVKLTKVPRIKRDPGAPKTYSRLPRSRLYVLACVGQFAFWLAFGGVRNYLFPLFADEKLLMSNSLVGGLLTLSALAALVVTGPAGRASNNGKLRVLAWSMAGYGVASALTGFATATVAVGLLLAAGGALIGFARVPLATLMSDVVDDTNRGRAVAFHQMSGDLGTVVGPVIAGLAIAPVGYTGSFALVSIPSVLVGLAAASRLRRRTSR